MNTEQRELVNRLNAEADLAEKATEFMSDGDLTEDTRAEITLLREAATEIVRLEADNETAWTKWQEEHDGYVGRSEEGVALLDRLSAVEQELKAANEWAQTMERERDFEMQVVSADLRERLTDAERALAVYADPQNWAIRRNSTPYADAIWIGPGATELVPDAPGVARAVLAPSQQEEK